MNRSHKLNNYHILNNFHKIINFPKINNFHTLIIFIELLTSIQLLTFYTIKINFFRELKPSSENKNYKIKNFYSMKHLIQKIKNEPSNWKRLFSNHISDTGSVLK